MFKKDFIIKSNALMRQSDCKHFRSTIKIQFPMLSESDFEEILPRRETVLITKIVLHNQRNAVVYTVRKNPVFFSVDGRNFPTVYVLWKLPYMAVAFTTNDFVISRINDGADLMTPGILSNPLTGDFGAKEVALINTIRNKAAVAVGLTCMNSVQMRSAVSGKGVIIYHFFGDKLCTVNDIPLNKLPQLGRSFDLGNEDEFPALGERSSKLPENDDGQPGTSVQSDSESSDEEKTEEELMDNLMIHTFYKTIKYCKTLELPMLTSAFYKTVMSNCPEGKVLDVKKSSYKKVGNFLKQMAQEDIIILTEQKKGVEIIEKINKEHPKFKSFYVDLHARPKSSSSSPDESKKIKESYAISHIVAPFFVDSTHRRGDILEPLDIRRCVTQYVKVNKLQSEVRGFIRVDDPNMRALFKHENAVTWEDLIDTVTAAMKPRVIISNGQEETVTKGKLQPITMTVQTRSSNKKVTLVDNLELFNIRVAEFAKECQHGVAASTSVSRPPGRKYDQIMIQGNQVLFVYNLLIEKYRVPKRFIRGLEYAPKKK